MRLVPLNDTTVAPLLVIWIPQGLGSPPWLLSSFLQLLLPGNAEVQFSAPTGLAYVDGGSDSSDDNSEVEDNRFFHVLERRGSDSSLGSESDDGSPLLVSPSPSLESTGSNDESDEVDSGGGHRACCVRGYVCRIAQSYTYVYRRQLCDMRG